MEKPSYCTRCGIPHNNKCLRSYSDGQIKVTVDDSKSSRVFLAAGNSVRYTRNDYVESQLPQYPAQRWPKKITTTHTLTWETVTYE